MNNLYSKIIAEDLEQDNTKAKLLSQTSTLRSLLQLVAVSMIEFSREALPEGELNKLSGLVERLCNPTDGLPIEIINAILPSLRSFQDPSLGWGWFNDSNSIKPNLSMQLSDWVVFRNSRAGHGVIDEKIAETWLPKTTDLIKQTLKTFKDFIPNTSKGGTLLLSPKLSNYAIDMPVIHQSSPIVISKVECRKGIWKLKGQVLSNKNAEQFVVTLKEDNIFSLREARNPERYTLAEVIVENEDLSFYHNIPNRETETFEGRKKELDKLNEWLNDEDSRMCLIYGDGGYGKTTLVLEFLNRYVEDKIKLSMPIPEVLSFHSAKLTRWTEKGLENLQGVANVMDECVRELMRLFMPNLPKDWYQVNGNALIQKAIGYLKQEKYTRDDILLIFDNTETLATDTHEVESLGEFLVAVSKKIGRLIITSRRREFVYATPIPVRELEEGECLNLIKRLAEDCNAIAIQKAGDARLRSICKQLTYKPLLISALVKYIGTTKTSIEEAKQNIFKRSNQELLEFLYEDAWARMNQSQKSVCMTLVAAASPIDQTTVRKACQLTEIPLEEFHKAFDETNFGTTNSYGEQFKIELVNLAEQFFEKQISNLQLAEQKSIREYADEVDKEFEKINTIEAEYKKDRVAEAFRSPFAKAAKIAAEKGNIENARENYELAICDEPFNSALHDRYAWFLFHKMNDSDKAEELWKKSIELNPNNCDAVVNMALCKYRSNQIDKGDLLIEEARKLGRTFAFCSYNKAKARYYSWIRSSDKQADIDLLNDSFSLLTTATRKSSPKDRYSAKVEEEIKDLFLKVRTQKIKYLQHTA